jgi:3-mercaptopyruvate sulfurtransferase SseA
MAASRPVVNGFRNGYDGGGNDREGAVEKDDEWVRLVKGMLRAEMARRQMTYDQLADRLGELGVRDTAVNIRNKVARGGFSAVFFVQCLKAMGCKALRLDESE